MAAAAAAAAAMVVSFLVSPIVSQMVVSSHIELVFPNVVRPEPQEDGDRFAPRSRGGVLLGGHVRHAQFLRGKDFTVWPFVVGPRSAGTSSSSGRGRGPKEAFL